jgi:hypothetical protein
MTTSSTSVKGAGEGFQQEKNSKQNCSSLASEKERGRTEVYRKLEARLKW